MKEEKNFLKKNLKEIMLFTGFIMYYVSQFYYQTMFEFPLIIIRILKYGGLLLIAIKIVAFNEFTLKEWLLATAIGILFAITAYFSSYRVLLEYLLVVMGFKNINYKKILILFLSVCSLSLLITIICCKIGIIENVITYRSNGDARQALGIGYCTDLAAFFFYIFTAYLCLNSRMSAKHILILSFVMLIGVYFLYKITHARLDCLSIIVSFVIAIITSIIPKAFWEFSFIKILLKNSIILFSAGIIIITIMYNPNIKMMNKFNEALTTRLSTGQHMYNKYGIKIWGQKIEEHGAGGNQEKRKQYEYGFIDCSYLKVLIKYGIVSLSVILLISLLYTRKIYKNQKYIILMMLIMIFINSTIAHHYTEIIYNYMILLLLCDFDGKQECR